MADWMLKANGIGLIIAFLTYLLFGVLYGKIKKEPSFSLKRIFTSLLMIVFYFFQVRFLAEAIWGMFGKYGVSGAIVCGFYSLGSYWQFFFWPHLLRPALKQNSSE